MATSAPTRPAAGLSEMIRIEGGQFAMGSNAHYPEEAPVHQVRVDGFFIDRFLVTNREFSSFVDSTGYVTFAEKPPNPADYPGALPEMLYAGSLVFSPPRHRVSTDDWSRWWRYVEGACWKRPYGAKSPRSALPDHPLASLATFAASEADAQRRGGGGRAGASMSRTGGSSLSGSRQVRSSATSNINYGRAQGSFNSGSSSRVAGTRDVNTASRTNINSGNRTNINTGNVNTGNRTNINTGNINTGDVNINRNVDVDVDHRWGYGDWDYRPGAVAAAAAVTTAVVVGSYYRSLPPNCATVYRGTIVYYQCGTSWYQPVYSGMAVQYVVVTAP